METNKMSPVNPIGLSDFSDHASLKLVENILAYDAKKAAERHRLRNLALINQYVCVRLLP